MFVDVLNFCALVTKEFEKHAQITQMNTGCTWDHLAAAEF